MASTQVAPTAATFPSVSEALKFGWTFFIKNFWLVLVASLLMGGGYALGGWLTGDAGNDSPVSVGGVIVALLLSIVGLLVGSLFELVLARRALDYWDEVQGRAAPRSFSDGLKKAIDGAKPRLFPYIGWSILVMTVFVVVMALGFVWSSDVSAGWSLVILLVLIVVFVAFMLIVTFFDYAVADGPGNPFPRAAHVLKGHFWTVVGTMLVFGLIEAAVALPVALVVMPLANESYGNALSAVTGGAVFGFFSNGIGLGVGVSMYRAVYPTTPRA